MKKNFITLTSFISLTACGSDNIANGMQYEFPECGTSQLNGKYIKKVCATRDSIAKKVSKDYTPKFLQILVGAGHTSSYSGGREGLILDFEDQELDLKGHVLDFSKQRNPGLIFKGHDSIIRNGIILNADIILGASYSPPNFSTGEQSNNSSVGKNINPDIIKYGFLYADNDYDCKNGTYVPCNIEQLKKLENAQRLKKRENIFIENIKNKANSFSLYSWGGGVLNSQLVLKNRLNIYGSKATFIKNKIISDAELRIKN